MDSQDISTISKKMESMSMTDRVRVIRHNKRLQQSRYSPYTTLGTNEKQKQKEEAVRLGAELSLVVAEAMFILSDDVRSTLVFCMCLLRYAGKINIDGRPVVNRLLYVIEYIFATYIKPKNGVYNDGGMFIHKELIRPYPQYFAFGVLDRIFLALKNNGLAKSSDFEQCNQELKKQVEKLKSFKDVSEANGFPREAIVSKILHLWQSLFETTPQVINLSTRVINPNTIVHEMFRPLVNEFNHFTCCRRLASLLI